MRENSEEEKESPNTLKVNPKGDWSWEEPSSEDFENMRKNFTFYRIYTIEDGKSKNLFKFWHINDSEALRVLNLFKESHPEYGDNCFYSTSGYYMDQDGSRHDTLFENDNKKDGIFMKIFDFFRYTIPLSLSDFWFKIKDTFYFFRHGHSMTESWSIDSHLLEDLKFNLKKLSENMNGCPTFMCERARSELKKPDKEEWNYDDEEMELAMNMWKNELDNLRENVLLYEYYSGYGIVDEKDEDMKLIDSKYRDTLPYKPGTNKGFDYEKLSALSKERWENIWNWIKEYGESLWD
jgi:hypothetical protein